MYLLDYSTCDYDYSVELRCDEGQLLVRDLVKLAGVNSVNLLSHDGEVTF